MKTTTESDKVLQAKYNTVKKRLHTCTPMEKQGLKDLFNYLHHKLVERNMI